MTVRALWPLGAPPVPRQRALLHSIRIDESTPRRLRLHEEAFRETKTMSDTTLALTARIVAAHIGCNTVRADQLPSLIRGIYQTLSTVGEAAAAPAKAKPVVEVKKSVFPSHLICLACGGSFKTLRRHLGSEHEMTVEQYRAKFGLPREYPMVSPNYAKVRSAMAKKIGLGHWRTERKARRKRG